MKKLVHIIVVILSSITIYNLLNKYLFNFIIILYFKKEFFAFFISVIISYLIYLYI